MSPVRSCLVSWLMAQVLASDSLDLALGFTSHGNLGLVMLASQITPLLSCQAAQILPKESILSD